MTVDLSAIAKWPNVPACYDWLSLDRRGDWRLQGERVTHSGLIAFINRQYGCDESGCWFLQNGPQRVFVSLAYTPWVFRCVDDAFVAHTGQPAGAVEAVYLDDEGSILLKTALGIGILDDRDLAGFLAQCRTVDQLPADETALLDLLSGLSGHVYWQELPIQPIAAVDVPERYKFNPKPQP
jgi:hypothetical protein